ncbi:E3 SUMO-protein ligase pli1, partial [Coemansia biformis]
MRAELNSLRIRDLKPLLDYHAATNPRFHDRVPSGPKARLVALLRWCLVNAYDDRNKDAYEKLVGYMSLASRKRAHSLILYSTYRWCDGQTYQIPTDGDWAAYDMGVNGPSSPRGLANETIGVPGVVPGGMVGPALLHSPAAVFAAVVAAAASARGHGMPDLIKGVFSDCGMLSAETNITSPEYWGASPTQVFTQTITFRLTSNQTDQLAPGNADPKKGVPGVYLFIGNFATINAGHFSTGKQIPVANPPQLSVMANSRNCLPLGHPATGLPIDLMPGLTKAPNCENRIDVAFMSSTSLVVAVVFARKHMPQSLVAKIRDTNRATTESVRQKFFGTSNSADDEDVIPEGALVSLKCPLGQCRIRTPARSTNCQHSQCFDCETFLQFYQNRQPWKCPVCSVSIQSWRELIVDGYFEEILQKTSEDDDQIYIEPNGDWKHKDNAAAGPLGSPAGKGRRRSVDAVDTVDLSDSSNLNNAARNKRQRTDYVDLTLDSDSDDAADAFDLPPLTQEEIDMINTLEAELTSESGSRSVTRSSSD